ncbi:MAG: outer membrane beta-barrel protein [Bacteroidaceae bacterium]|nr:outer membrane beta-barrel protein [Bacteroidaceae bacterium]
MKRTISRLCVALLLAVLTGITADAQKTMDVAKFTRMDNDLMARVTKPVRDKDEGKLCALIRVVTTLPSLEFRADALGIVQQEKHGGEVWLYVPYGAKSLSFSHEGYFPLLYQYALPIEEGTVYQLQLASYETPTQGSTQQTNTQMFVLTHTPEEATVYIDGMNVPTENGIFSAMMSKGEHTYKVEADQYEETEGTFVLDDQPVRETINLQPLFATIQLYTLPENDFNISLNGRFVGTSPYKSERLEAGSYRIHIEKDKYYPIDTLVRLREGDNVELTCKLTSFADSLFYNRELGGHRFSFGVNVGYLMPFVSSNAGGGFTGSPINYALGNSQENVDYSSQSGFSAGIMVDYKLYKNFYLMAGVSYSQYSWSNSFNQKLTDHTVLTTTTEVWKGDMENSYKERYTLRTIEIPILASYRFVLTKTSSLHLNLGPYFQYGLSANMNLSGSSESKGTVYNRIGNTLGAAMSSFTDVSHLDSDFDLYGKEFTFQRTNENGATYGLEERFTRSDSPYKRFNLGLRAAVAYELRGFQLSLGYNLQLTNSANTSFWESERIPIFNGKDGENHMSGYKHRVHSLEVRLGYFFRY